MSSIDIYKHKLLDFFECPSDFELVFGNSTKSIAIYELEEDIPEEELAFDGKAGDLLVGGGSGEAEALRISRKAIEFFKDEDFVEFDSINEILKPFWSPAFAFKIGNGLKKPGWSPNENLEFWLAEKVINQLLDKGKITLPNHT